MKIWFLTTEYPPFFGGGISTYNLHTTRMFSSRGHDITFFVPDYSITSGYIIEENFFTRVVRFSPSQSQLSESLGETARMSYAASEVIKKFCEQEGLPDVVEVQDYLGLGYFILQLKKTLEKPFIDLRIILTCHSPKGLLYKYDNFTGFNLPDYWTYQMEKFCYKAADAVIFPSLYISDLVAKTFELPSKFYILPHPFEQVSFNIEDKPALASQDYFLYVGRLQRLKGIDELLSSFRRIWNADQFDGKLQIIGDDWFDELMGNYYSEQLLKKFQDLFESGNVIWHRKLPPQSLMPMYRDARALVFPSKVESFSYVVAEAMSMGGLIISSKTGGHAELLGKNAGLTYSKDMYEKILQSIKIQSDARKKICDEAKNRIKELCNYKQIGLKKEEIICEVIRKQDTTIHFPYLTQIPKPFKQKNIVSEISSRKELLSIVIPYYNLGNYVEDTIKSLYNIDGIENEIIIVDDGSTESYSIEKLEEITVKFPNIKVIRKQNSGLALTRNFGAQIAGGEFLAFIDADDLIIPEFYTKAIAIMKRYKNVSFVGCWVEYFGETSGYWPTWNPEPPFIFIHNMINSSGLIFKRDDFLRFGKNDPQLFFGMEDYDSVLSMLENGCYGVSIPIPYFKYRVRSNSMYRLMNRKIHILSYEYIMNKHHEFLKDFADDVISIINSNGPGYMYDNPTWFLPKLIYEMDRESTEKISIEETEYKYLKLAELDLKLLLEKFNHPLVKLFLGKNKNLRRLRNRYIEKN